MDKQAKITHVLELNSIISTSVIAERSGIPFNEAENTLIEMEELELVFNVSDNDWMIKE